MNSSTPRFSIASIFFISLFLFNFLSLQKDWWRAACNVFTKESRFIAPEGREQLEKGSTLLLRLTVKELQNGKKADFEAETEENLSKKEMNKRKLAEARRRDAEKYGEEYVEVTDDDLK